jgi:hypothetical protein
VLLISLMVLSLLLKRFAAPNREGIGQLAGDLEGSRGEQP